ncbi:hypothetical protein [uncultured Corynebacterium sp.]|uniref:hypothetical protein n=1 Tax=uncultured Corynebacterium sp. TaxID=159447 RepID=UPI00261F7077|nr:hypothetical protein [uncultured Corynebacterium sp.]
MFSFFKKKQPEQTTIAEHVSAPTFDYTAQIPQGWELLIDGENPTPILSYSQIRSAMQQLEEWSFLVVQKTGDSSVSAQALSIGQNFYRAEVLVDEEPLAYGIPLKKGAKHGHGETGIDDAALVLCTFIRDDGAVPQFPHLVASRADTSSYSFGGW